jgi:hypothetical protein
MQVLRVALFLCPGRQTQPACCPAPPQYEKELQFLHWSLTGNTHTQIHTGINTHNHNTDTHKHKHTHKHTHRLTHTNTHTHR